MNVNEKMKVFTKTAIDDATEARDLILLETKEKLDVACVEAEKREERNSSETLKKEQFKIEQMKNKDIMAQTTLGKREMITLKTEMLKKMEENVVYKLERFMDTEQYDAYLLKKIKQYKDKYFDVTIEILERDARLSEQIKTITNYAPKISQENFIGGFKCLLNSKNAFIDMTFSGKLFEEIKNFNEFRLQ